MTLTSPVSTASSKAAKAALGLGVVAALLTTTLAFVSLGLGALALVLGARTIRRIGPTISTVVGMTAAAVSIYVIVLEIHVVGG
jgi:hypothetical protein